MSPHAESVSDSAWIAVLESGARREIRSIYQQAWEEAERHKWIESQKSGHDLGTSALQDWFHRFWWLYCRARRLEHVQGFQQWLEFSSQEFGQLHELILQQDLLLDRILDRLEHGYENLGVIQWAQNWGLPMDDVLSLLELVNINGARLPTRVSA